MIITAQRILRDIEKKFVSACMHHVELFTAYTAYLV